MIIGIVGGVGSGKSEVLNIIKRRFGARIIMADAVGAKIMRAGEPGFEPIVELFGPEVIGAEGELDREYIASRVYKDETLMGRLEAIVHPLVKKEVKSYVEHLDPDEICFYECAIMFETRSDEICHKICGIITDDDIRIQRLQENRGYSPEKSREIMSKQMSCDELRKRCDFVIENNRGKEELETQVMDVLEKYFVK
ncbi:MAG: dephospho-CoA kinase [Eubacterium sp.]|nr:dephospho-CoA kinase [Eubacterium sp.]